MANGMVVLTTPSSDIHLLLNFLSMEWQNRHFYVPFFFGLTDISLKRIQTMILSSYVALLKILLRDMFIYVYITTYIYIDMHYVYFTYVYILDN